MAKKNLNAFDLEPVKKNTHIIVIDADIGSSNFTTKKMTLDLAQRLIVDAKLADYSIVDTDELITANSTSGILTLTLLTAVGRKGKTITVKRINAGANDVVIDPAGAETIDGAATKVLGAQFDKVTIVSDGTNWLEV